ncbi:MAG TPA: hypothetical protein VNE62_12090 [Actinomycetota bacterium]|nr:hypothetical protein [Actinomycetota bacterium]
MRSPVKPRGAALPGAGGEQGVTVIELAIAVAILSVLIAGVFGFLTNTLGDQAAQQSRAEAQDDLRSTMARLSKAVRQATSVDPSSTTSRLQMKTIIAGVEQQVTYTAAGTELKRRIGSGSDSTVAKGLLSPGVFCYDPPACIATGPGTLHLTILRLTLIVQPSDDEARPLRLATDIQFRNVRPA